MKFVHLKIVPTVTNAHIDLFFNRPSSILNVLTEENYGMIVAYIHGGGIGSVS